MKPINKKPSLSKKKTSNVNEGWDSPMGLVRGGINKLAGKIPQGWSDTADRMKGGAESGALANKHWSTYLSKLGQSGEKPTSANLFAFLQNNGFGPESIAAAKKVINAAGQKKAATANPQLTKFGGASAPASSPAASAPASSPDVGARARGQRFADNMREAPMYESNLMRKYIDILRESTEIDLDEGANTPLPDAIASKAIMAAVNAKAGGMYQGAKASAPASSASAPASSASAPASSAGAPASSAGAPASSAGAPASSAGAPASSPAADTGYKPGFVASPASRTSSGASSSSASSSGATSDPIMSNPKITAALKNLMDVIQELQSAASKGVTEGARIPLNVGKKAQAMAEKLGDPMADHMETRKIIAAKLGISPRKVWQFCGADDLDDIYRP